MNIYIADGKVVSYLLALLQTYTAVLLPRPKQFSVSLWAAVSERSIDSKIAPSHAAELWQIVVKRLEDSMSRYVRSVRMTPRMLR